MSGDQGQPAAPAAEGEKNVNLKRIEVNRYHGRPLALVMVGLPARGKSYIARRLSRYINWLGIRTKLFKSAEYRHKSQPNGSFNHSYFDPNNAEGVAARTATAQEVLADICTYFKEGKGNVAIMDAENVTTERRDLIFEALRGVLDEDRIIFIEIVRDDGPHLDAILEQHIVRSPSYCEKEHDVAKADYEQRIAHYQRVYNKIEGDKYAYIRMTNDNEGVEMNNVRGYLPTRVVNYLCQINLNLRPIYCSRHGESEYNLLEKLGGDSNLSEEGQKYSAVLKDFVLDVKSKLRADEELEIWTSTLKRTRQTVAPLQEMGYKVVHWRALDEINAGVCDGLTYEEVAERMPEEFEKRQKDKYNYRYPKGESYHDLIQRIEPVMMELERVKKVVVIVCHQAVLRCMYAYLMELLPVTCVRNEIPLHTIFKISSSSSGEMACDKIVLMPHSGKQH